RAEPNAVDHLPTPGIVQHSPEPLRQVQLTCSSAVEQIVKSNDSDAEDRNGGSRQEDKSCQKDHARADYPDDPATEHPHRPAVDAHVIIDIERPAESNECQVYN